MKGIAATSRTLSAIRKADSLPVDISGGKMRKGVYPGGFGGGAYNAPFTVVKASDTSVTILGYHADEGRTWKNYIALGNSWVEAAEATVSSITSTGYLYLEITYSSGYVLTFKFSAGETPPSKDNTKDIIIVRRIVCVDGKISSINNPVNIVSLGGKVY